jgi:hypothetical protein
MSNLQQKVSLSVTTTKLSFSLQHSSSCAFSVLQIDDKKKAIKTANNELKDLKHEAKGSDSVTLAKYDNKNQLCESCEEK